MSRSMITAANTMNQLQKKLDTIGNNLANVNTNGYKRRETSFNDLLVQQYNSQSVEREEVGRKTPNGIRQGNGAKISETALRMELGSIQTTDRELDLALTNKHQLFQVQTLNDNGEQVTRYTRDGAFYLSPNEDGELSLVTGNGEFVMGIDGPITIPEDFKSITVNESGEVVVTYPDNFTETVGELDIVEVIRPQLLINEGNNLYALPNLGELNLIQQDVIQFLGPDEISVQQFALEASNVNVSDEMTEMMVAQRAYQFNSKSISIADQMMGLINGLR